MSAAQLRQLLVDLAREGGEDGVTMGSMVDALVDQGHDAGSVEMAIWQLMQERHLTPNGFVCRVVKRRDEDGQPQRARTYEFLLVPWSPDRDRQLDLDLEGSP